MTFSVLIPCYNAEKTIDATLASVFAQTLQPDEILVLNDGSTDDTLARLEKYKDRIVVLSQKNSGAAHARNRLVETAHGDIFAFLDADDLWHPSYLKVQQRMISMFPQAAGYFTWHDDFAGYGFYSFRENLLAQPLNAKTLSPEVFLVEYNKRPMRFQMSCFCLPKRVLSKIDGPPFGEVTGECLFWSEDTYMHNMLPLLGSVVHTLLPLVAYRIAGSSLSSNQLKWALAAAAALEKLDAPYKKSNKPLLHRAFKLVIASGKRTGGKCLMEAGRISEAREQFCNAARCTTDPLSRLKSLGLLSLAWLPLFAQKRYPLKEFWSKRNWRSTATQ